MNFKCKNDIIKNDLPLEEQIIRAIVASKNKSIVNVSYETIGNVTTITID